MIRDAPGVRGLKVYRFMEREFGAEQFFMMRGELTWAACVAGTIMPSKRSTSR